MVYQRISSFFNQEFQRVLEIIPWTYDSEQGRITRAFSGIESERSKIVYVMVYNALIKLMRRRRNSFGMMVVCGWKREWLQEYASFPDSSQNIFADEEYVIANHSVEGLIDTFAKTADFDGAILVNTRGSIRASGVYLENMHPKEVAQKMGARAVSDLSEAFGFVRKVHTRHLAGIACSYLLPETVVFVVSEEHKDLRIFKNGQIIYSTFTKEIPHERT